jgi:tetratricopeptide (TPR) repeat protein
MGYFKNIDVYDLNANLFDLRPYESSRANMSENKLREINARTASAPGARVFCAEFTSYPEMSIFPSLYGIIYRLSGDKKTAPVTSRWLEICSLRDYFNSKELDISYRSLLSRYFITGAEYSALKGDRLGFENFRAIAEKTCPEDPGILATIASAYFFYMSDIKRSIEYLERAVDLDPHYTASIRLLVKLYPMEGDMDSAKKWARIYMEREKDGNKLAEFRAQDGIYLLQK